MLPKGAIYFLFETVNTDLVVIAVYAVLRLPKLSELWIECRTGKTMEFIPLYEISKTFGPPVCNEYLFFHAFSDCDTPSSSYGKGKKFGKRHSWEEGNISITKITANVIAISLLRTFRPSSGAIFNKQ